MRYSIIRRSGGFTVLFLVGHAFNYGLFWGANRILDNASFGLFYTAMLTINIMMSPVTAVTLVLAKRFAEVGAKDNHDEVVAALTRRLLGWCLRGGPVVVTAGIGVAVAARRFGIEAWQVIVLIPVTVLILAAVEILRASLQGMLKFARASALWVASTGIGCTFAFGALLLSMKVWAAIAGLLFGSSLAVGVSYLTWYPRPEVRECATSSIAQLHLKRAIPMIGSYSLFILLNNIDVLIGYFLLPSLELDVYAASALLPKAIITATFAIAQVILPVITEQRSSGLSFRSSAGKGLGLVVLVAAAAGATLWIAAPTLQHSPFSIRGLDYRIMDTLAVGAVAMSILRVLVVVEVALQRYAVGFAQAGAVALFALLCLKFRGGPFGIATLYATTASGFMLLSCLVFIATWAAARRRLLESQ